MFEKILAAKKRLQGHANVTPIMTSRTLNRQVGAEIYFKCENLQRIGRSNFAAHSTVYLNFQKRKKNVASLRILQEIMPKP